MSEREFWDFLNAQLRKGRMSMLSARIDCRNVQLNEAEKFICGHSLLPAGYENISSQQILRMGSLLFQQGVQMRTKEAVMMLLAHHPSREALAVLEKYNACPDEGLRIFAELALDECCMWNEEAGTGARGHF